MRLWGGRGMGKKGFGRTQEGDGELWLWGAIDKGCWGHGLAG